MSEGSGFHFPCALCPFSCIASSPSHPYQSATFATCSQPASTHHHHSRSTVYRYFRVHSLVVYILWVWTNVKWRIPTVNSIKKCSFFALKILYTAYSPPFPPPAHDSFPLSSLSSDLFSLVLSVESLIPLRNRHSWRGTSKHSATPSSASTPRHLAFLLDNIVNCLCLHPRLSLHSLFDSIFSWLVKDFVQIITPSIFHLQFFSFKSGSSYGHSSTLAVIMRIQKNSPLDPISSSRPPPLPSYFASPHHFIAPFYWKLLKVPLLLLLKLWTSNNISII